MCTPDSVHCYGPSDTETILESYFSPEALEAVGIQFLPIGPDPFHVDEGDYFFSAESPHLSLEEVIDKVESSSEQELAKIILTHWLNRVVGEYSEVQAHFWGKSEPSLLQDRINFLEEKIAQYTPIANSLTTLCETAGQFSASLVQGGGEFEAACHQGSELTDWISMLEERLHEAKMETTKRHTD